MTENCIFNHAALAFCFAVTLFGTFTEALNLEEAEEGVCRGVPKSISQQEFNLTWMDSVPEWYVPVGSRYELYRIALHRLNLSPEDEQFKSMSEEELINKGCFKGRLNLQSGSGLLYGFEKEGYVKVELRAGRKNSIDVVATGSLTRTPGIGRHYVTLTDNKTFVIFSICWLEADQKSWEVFSTSKTLSSKAKQLIEEHAISLGFNPKKFISMNYDNCSSI
ncbi:hypothetical protein Ocin01_07245 [Orchesella cincta]|uniref:Apolipoprotein D n=1 Tax=Orchesella cincta TaxID=48709 RepID=A0A1D2N293_ORCCI|nr:hypothetical protein Ocin01_07245 [Orchesella cincta]